MQPRGSRIGQAQPLLRSERTEKDLQAEEYLHQPKTEHLFSIKEHASDNTEQGQHEHRHQHDSREPVERARGGENRPCKKGPPEAEAGS